MNELKARVRWKCRRGMLELDKLLLQFFEQRFSQLSLSEQQSFARLLDHEDQELLDWLYLCSEPKDPGLMALIQMIREVSRIC